MKVSVETDNDKIKKFIEDLFESIPLSVVEETVQSMMLDQIFYGIVYPETVEKGMKNIMVYKEGEK